MANQKISELPRKVALAESDILLVVDTQFGSTNYINKKTTVGDLLKLAEIVVNNQVNALNTVISVNGIGGVVVLAINQLAGVGIDEPLDNQLLAFDATQNVWVNKPIDDIAFVIDGGNF
jgi:hypothetical protein